MTATKLTYKQKQVLLPIANGLTAVQTAERLGISLTAVKTRIITARMATGARSHAHLVALAMKHGDITPEEVADGRYGY